MQQKSNIKNLMDSYFSFCEDQKRGLGEDCVLRAVNPEAVFLGTFDGCGGAGAKSYPGFDGHTGAYIASRTVGEAFLEWFESNGGRFRDGTEIRNYIVQLLNKVNDSIGQKSALKGMISKIFPTTVAAVVCRDGGQSLQAQPLWAGDSRVYYLNEEGLAQLTEDDLGGIDAMENLTKDGILKNVVSLSQIFEIHTANVSLPLPGIVFAATDGCFGYLSTPMEFEFLLLRTLLETNSIAEWEAAMKAAMRKVAGDDFTICGAAFGYGSFSAMQKKLQPRAEYLYKWYINGLDNRKPEEKLQLWGSYKNNYYRYLCR
nr:protein phosphatase 2C domain-containing protein [Lachnospiraceae bacterium]